MPYATKNTVGLLVGIEDIVSRLMDCWDRGLSWKESGNQLVRCCHCDHPWGFCRCGIGTRSSRCHVCGKHRCGEYHGSPF